MKFRAFIIVLSLCIFSSCVNSTDTELVQVSGTISLEDGTEFEFGDHSRVSITLYYQVDDETIPEVIYTEEPNNINSFPFEYELPLTIDLNEFNETPGSLYIEAIVNYGPQKRLLVDDIVGRTIINPEADVEDDISLTSVEFCDSTNSEICSNFKAGKFCGTLDFRLFVTEDYINSEVFFQNYIFFEAYPKLWYTDVSSNMDWISETVFEIDTYTAPDYAIVLEDCKSLLVNIFGRDQVFSQLPYTIPFGVDLGGLDNLIFGRIDVPKEIKENYVQIGDELLTITVYSLDNDQPGDFLFTAEIEDITDLPFSYSIIPTEYISDFDASNNFYVTAELSSVRNFEINNHTGNFIFRNPDDYPHAQFDFMIDIDQ